MAGVNYVQDNTDYSINEKELKESEQAVSQAQNLYENTDMVKLMESYLKENVPPNIKKSKIYKQFWAVIGNTIKLSFLDKSDIHEYECLFEIARSTYIISIPPSEYTFEDMQILKQLKIYYKAALQRAVGSNNHKFNERIIQGGTIVQQIRSNTERGIIGNSGGGGFFSKLKGSF